ETLIALDFGDKIIAADTQSTDIEGLSKNIEYFDLMTPDIEKLIELKPDVVFASTMSIVEGNDPFKPLKDLGICVIYIPSSNSIEAIYEDTIFIADVMQVHEKGQKIVDDMQAKIDEFKEKSASIENKKTVYFEIAAAPYMYSFGKGVFLNEMIEIIGAENALGNQESWIAVSEETILAANPDVIITNVNYVENPTDEILSRNGWENITAIKKKQVYYVDNMASSLPNQNIIIALEQMAKAIYPDVY
ncbi:MAG: ABC transporter substrate-binding protein, partial [Tissierellia bacterium]|nr:ABC transporter substrate-binding protein [Tissierellia bacterium]